MELNVYSSRECRYTGTYHQWVRGEEDWHEYPTGWQGDRRGWREDRCPCGKTRAFQLIQFASGARYALSTEEGFE